MAHAQALIVAMTTQVVTNAGFTNAVLSTAADTAASVTVPEQVTITLPTGPTLTISDGPYVAGDTIAVAFTGASSATDWVGMYVAAAHVGTSRFFRISGL